MCGIAGGWWREEAFSVEKRLKLAIEKMKHRGPNDHGIDLFPTDSGVIGLAHARLSIIDLSDRGHQPMVSICNRYSIVFNGEIYNYRELRDELITKGASFISESDTEVLLVAWKQWGKACLTRLDGMFAFAVHDRLSQRLFCVRDGFGIKPLYYSQNAGFAFASELASIQAVSGNKNQLDWQAAYDYLVHGRQETDQRSFIEGVQQLAPGHLVELDLKKGELSIPQKWWYPSITESFRGSYEDAVRAVRERFLESVRLQLRSDVPIGAALSGGVDSSSIVCAIRHLEPDATVNTSSYIASRHSISEESWVDQVNAHVGAVSNKVSAQAGELAADLDDMIRAQGEPFGSTSIYAQYRVFRLAKECGITVTLDGQGADEMLGGYEGYPGHRFHSLIDRREFGSAIRFLRQWSKWPGRSQLSGLRYAVSEMTPDQLYPLLRRLGRTVNATPDWLDQSALADHGVICGYPNRPDDSQDRGRRLSGELLRQLTTYGLPALLRYGDRNSMRFSIESRVPFLSPPLVDLMLSLPEEYLVSPAGETKSIFRRAMRGIVPDAILDRKDKIGFATPEQPWLFAMKETLREWLSQDMDLPFYKQKVVLNEMEMMLSGQKPFTWQLWRWVNFARWHAHFIA